MYYSGSVKVSMETRDEWRGPVTLAAIILEGFNDYMHNVIDIPTKEGLENVLEVLTSRKFDGISLGCAHKARDHFNDLMIKRGYGPAFIGVA